MSSHYSLNRQRTCKAKMTASLLLPRFTLTHWFPINLHQLCLAIWEAIWICHANTEIEKGNQQHLWWRERNSPSVPQHRRTVSMMSSERWHVSTTNTMCPLHIHSTLKWMVHSCLHAGCRCAIKPRAEWGAMLLWTSGNVDTPYGSPASFCKKWTPSN